jgi:phytoene dehydrogenase-like protein
MIQEHRKVVIIGGGIAGLCAAVYAQQCGYQTEVLEMHDTAGGLATSWRRGGYTFETCLHWLLGSNPRGTMYRQWAEVFDIDKLDFIYPEEFVRLETEHGERLRIYSDIELLEAELLGHAPEDAAEIHRFAASLRSLARIEMPDPTAGLAGNWKAYLRDIPHLPLLRRLLRITSREYGARFKNPLLRNFFSESDTSQMSAIALFFSLAWMHQGDAGYPVGGSQAVIRLIEQRLASLGGHLRLGARVKKILVKDGAAVGVELINGETIAADWVISAADGHETLYDLLEGKFLSKPTEKIYREFDTFPSYVQVSLGVAHDLSNQPGFVIRVLDEPFQVDPATTLKQISFRIFHFDPTFAPSGKTAVTSFLPTRDFEYWLQLKQSNPAIYQEEKQRVAQAAIEVLERMVPGLGSAIEVLDVSTPATIIRYTGNWKGSMEGWLPTPATGFSQLPNTLPGLRHFMMAGQWIMPGGGLPSGLFTARSAVQSMCRQDRISFVRARKPAVAASPVSTARPTSASTAAH